MCGYCPQQYSGLRRGLAAGSGIDRQRRDRRDHRRLCGADDPRRTRRSTARCTRQPQFKSGQSARSGRRTSTTSRRPPAGLVRRGDPRRRGGARHGAGRQRGLRRRHDTSVRPRCSRGPRPIDNHVADIVTNSWGEATTRSRAGPGLHRLLQQFSLEAALTGITVNFSTGDDGDQTVGGATRGQAPVTSRPTRRTSLPSAAPASRSARTSSGWVSTAGKLVLHPGQRRVDAEPAGDLQLRRRRRHQPAIRPAVLPAGHVPTKLQQD